MSNPVALIVGAGEGTGAALARRFAGEDMTVALVRRNADALNKLVGEINAEGGRAIGFPADATKEQSVTKLVTDIEKDLGPIALAIQNPSLMLQGAVVDLDSDIYRQGLRLAFAAFLTGREVARRMIDRASGTIIFTSSTASLRGSAGNAVLASGRFAVRALAESMARELHPRGIHVAHLAIDGMIDTPALRAAVPDHATQFEADSLLSPDTIAEHCWRIHQQPKDAWSHHEVLRPWKEKW